MLSLSSLAFTFSLVALAILTGRAVLRVAGLEEQQPHRWLTIYLSLPLGLGVLITALFVLAAAGFLTAPAMLGTAALLALACWGVFGFRLPQNGLRISGPGGVVILALLAYALLLAHSAPLAWDELSYHLPYARDYAQQGGLVVSEYLRYPLHSHNYQLLYAAALIFSNELAAHQLHAISGLWVIIGVFLFSRDKLGRAVAWISAYLMLELTGGMFDVAYVDLGLCLFVFSAFIGLTAWQSTQRVAYLYLAAFMLAMAIGIKYQGLVQLLPFAIALWIDRRSLPLWAGLVATLVLFGGGWFLRSFLVSGDPIHPMGGSLFGFWQWDERDLAMQVRDIAKYQHQLHAALWPALGCVFFLRDRGAWYRNLVIMAGVGLVTWYISSRYDRYLVATLPFLAILSADVLVQAWRRWAPERWVIEGKSRRLAIIVGSLFALALASDVITQWDRTCFTASCVEEVQAQRTLTHGVRTQVPDFDSLRVYQLGLEKELYLLGKPVFGDFFGKYRYHHVLDLDGNGFETAAYLETIGANALLVNRQRMHYLPLEGMEPALDRVYEDDNVVLFVLPE